MIDPEENHMVTGYGFFDEERAARREAREEAAWEHADDQYNDEIDFEYEEETQ